MKLYQAIRAFSLLVLAAGCIARDYDTYDYYAIHLDPSHTPQELASHLGLEYDAPLGSLHDHHVFRAPRHDGDVVDNALKRRKRSLDPGPHVLDGVRSAQKQKLRKRLHKRDDPAYYIHQRQDPEAVARQQTAQVQLKIKDPQFSDQWHLVNTEQPGNDLNVTGVWLEGITGKNATVCIIDDGLDMYSDDLKANYLPEGSFDFNDRGPEPKPRLSDDHHGTRCAGEIAAARNDVCGVGVAYDSKISGIRILSKPITDIDEAEAVNYKLDVNQIFSCSWGPPDDGRTMDGPGILIQKALVTATQQGRGGLGTIYVLAAGNGANNDDNCNFDGYANSLYTVTVGAVDRKNDHPYYSEKCSAQLFVTYSSGSGDSIHTTDVGKNVCTESHGGTSAAGPLAAGVFALALSVRPDLSWRDMQYLGLMSAIPFYEQEPESEWQETAIGKKYSHQYGYGRLDAYALVDMAKTWTPVKRQAWLFSKCIYVNKPIPQGNVGLAVHWDVLKEDMADVNLARLEHVQVLMNVDHTRRGDISVELRSPSGVVSHLSTARRQDVAQEGYSNWMFMSVAHWGELGAGRWTVIVKDANINEHNGTFLNWQLRFWGESMNSKDQPLSPMPEDKEICPHDPDAFDDVEHATTSVSHPATTGTPIGNPTDHPDRPVAVKPTDTSLTSLLTGTPTATTPSTAAQPTSTGTDTNNSTLPSLEDEDKQSNNNSTSFLPSSFPTFGVSKRTQVWIYGSLALITVFCSSLAGYFWWQKRRNRKPRDNYEFEMLDDREGAAEGDEAALMGGAKRKKRAGELYDAFAGDSDEDVFSSEDEDEHYRDSLEEDRGREKGPGR